ncbi:hypothetical protein GCM10023091_38600 [Ravibacter arvi]|uniref:Uncharacterized protein n=1 Tax=Ravibacter arvi TaxID=2051041 RepID=A0ABP8MA23_9BACT
MSQHFSRRKFLLSTGLGIAGTTALNAAPDTPVSGGDHTIGNKTGTAPDDTQTFAAEVERILPKDQPYGHHKRIAEGPLHVLCRDRGQAGTNDEFSLEGWQLQYISGGDQVIETAVEDFREFMKVSMDVEIPVLKIEPAVRAKKKGNQIVVGLKEYFPQYAANLKGPKAYALIKEKQQLLVIGYDPVGVLQGLFCLEAQMKFREGPFLEKNLRWIREAVYERRMVLSGLGWMEWPDNQLAHIAHNGFDGLFTSVYANANGDRTTPETSTDFYARLMYRIRRQSPERVHDLIKRAARWGIKVYTPIIYQYTGTAESEAGLRKLVKDIIREFPEMGGYVLLTEGFWYQKWGGLHGADEAHVKNWADNWAKAVGIVTEECHRVNPETHILAWEYNIDFRPQNVKLKRYFVQKLPQDAIPSLTWENGKGFELDGMQGFLRDYSLSQVGPAEVTQGQIEEANARGMKVFSKVDTFASWQFGTIPYLPFPGQWRKRYDALAKYGVKGTIESWSSGFTPNFISELRYWTCWNESLSYEDLIGKMASRLFGKEQKEKVLQAWVHFDQAIRQIPDTGPNMGTNNAIGNPLFFQEPPLRTATFHKSWMDHNMWMGYLGGELNPYWPFTVTRMVFYPDFTNKTNRAEQYARGATGIVAAPGTPLLPVFLKYLKNASAEMEKGLKLYRSAALASPEWKRAIAVREVVVAEHLHRMMDSNAAVLEFENYRLQWAAATDAGKANSLLDQMEKILKEEIARTKLSQLAVSRDSRFGFQFEQDYVYTPYSLSEKMKLLQETLSEQLPAARR